MEISYLEKNTTTKNNYLNENTNNNIVKSLIDQQWKLANAISLNIQQVIGMAWSNNSAAFALNSGDSVQIFLSQCIEFFVDSDYAVIQVSAQLLNLVKITDPIETQELQLHSNIRGFFVTENYLTLWDDTKIQLDKIHCPESSPIKIENVASFDVNNIIQAAYYNQHIYTLANEQLLVRTLQGTVKRSITFREIEGKPELINVKGCWLCVASSLGYIRIYDLNESSMKLTFRSSNLRNSIPTFSNWQNIRINSLGNRVSFTLRKVDEEYPSEYIYVWEAENDSVGYYSFALGITDQQQYEQDSVATLPSTGSRPKTAAIRKIESEQSRFRLPFYIPGNFFWDQNDARLLICEAISINNLNDGIMQSPSYLLTMFVTAEHGIQMQDLQQKSTKMDSLIFVSVPYIYFLRNIEADDEDEPGGIEQSISRLVIRRTLREFIGIDNNDKEAIQAMLDFSFYLCIGQMDNAFKAIKYIKSESVWEHMARMCVKTRRIDVARVCLGHMGNARALRAIRRTIELKELTDLQIGRLAIELGMIEEAIHLYEKSNRFDLSNKIYQAQGKWNEAFSVAEENDRINLRNTYYNYAKQLESVGAFEKAIENYEKANTHHFDVPRMLCDEPKVLEFYIKKKAEPELYKWWAQFLESTGDLETAKNFYQNAKDYLSVVRIFCHNGQFQEAIHLTNQTKDRAAAFHLAMQFETQLDFNKAVQFFTQSGAYSNAIRLAKENNMVDKVANLALMAGGSELAEAAEYYKNISGHADKTVMLYHKAGMVGSALDFACKTGQFGALDLIASELNEKSDPTVLTRAAQFFSSNQQDRIAVQLLVYAKKYIEAIQLCLKKNVIINDELDNLLTPNNMENLSTKERSTLLEQIARCCLQQSNYYFAAKKFTQAGNKLEAIKALLKSGDTQKVILFANTARDKDIYRMAGNYLQTLNWKENAQLMRQIEAFYLKAGAVDLLANFYEACAQVEIEEYHDYEKAAAAYSEAIRCLNKKINKNNSVLKNKQFYLTERQEQLREILETIQQFLDIKILYEKDPGESMRLLGEFSEKPDIDSIVRLGDIYSILIGHNVKRNNFRKAWSLIEHCEQNSRPRIDIRQYLNKNILDQICDQVGVPRLKSATQKLKNEEDNEEDELKEGDETIEFSHSLRRHIGGTETP
ncbi:Amidase domain-containing protein [Meloidogyne graminicola]|uniref:Amidase domain-containing protein n=1 Tax=Meloidogyne graminicola TaxID=189291 RepID=A0A8S9ZWD7_9BILA|nr:Amidase domain-containing protein [Meloidogyne graminicola]